MRRLKRPLRVVAVLLFSIIILYWGIAIVKCEWMTYMYGYQFDTLYVEYTMFNTPDYHKVIDYTGTTAKIYYVNRGSGGDVVHYKRSDTNSEWSFVEWTTVWSSSGSADNFIWPYIR